MPTRMVGRSGLVAAPRRRWGRSPKFPRLIIQCDFAIPRHIGRAWWLPGGVLPDRAEDIGKPDQVVAHGPGRVGEPAGVGTATVIIEGCVDT